MVEWAQEHLPWWTGAAYVFALSFGLAFWGMWGFLRDAKQHDRSGR